MKTEQKDQRYRRWIIDTAFPIHCQTLWYKIEGTRKKKIWRADIFTHLFKNNNETSLRITKRKINAGNKFFFFIFFLISWKKRFFFFFKQYLKIRHNRFGFIESDSFFVMKLKKKKWSKSCFRNFSGFVFESKRIDKIIESILLAGSCEEK